MGSSVYPITLLRDFQGLGRGEGGKRKKFPGMKLHAALHACTTMNENQVQQTRQHDKI